MSRLSQFAHFRSKAAPRQHCTIDLRHGAVCGQWLIIHGRFDGKLLAAEAAVASSFFLVPGLQQVQEPECFRGAWEARSLVAKAVRRAPSIPAKLGAVSITRGAEAPQVSHAQGWSYSAIGRNASNGPHFAQSYSYTGILEIRRQRHGDAGGDG